MAIRLVWMLPKEIKSHIDCTPGLWFGMHKIHR